MLVTVWMTAYNHELYITKAIDSVLMQQTNFDVEIVIGEDCSTDHTRSIVLDYNEKYPEKFSLLLPEKNLGMIPMFMASHQLCKGKYVAWLDGDDYWTDPLKLQKQVNFMEGHQDYVMCFHNVEILDQEKNIKQIKSIPQGIGNEPEVTVDFFCSHNPVASSSVMCRNVLPPKLPDWFAELPYPDLAYYFLLMEKGKIKFLDEVMGLYRVHNEGAWSGESRYSQFRTLTEFYEKLDRIFAGKYSRSIARNSTWMYNELLNASLNVNDRNMALQSMLHIVKNDPKYIWQHRKFFAKTALAILLRKKY